MSSNLNILIHNKNEFIDRLDKTLSPSILEGIYSIYNNIKSKNKVHKYILKEFQQELANTPDWSQSIINGEFDRIKNNSKCTWLDDLIKNIFMVNAEILSITSNEETKQDKLTISLPSPQMFIHKCYVNVARHIWKNPQLCYHKLLNSQIIENKNKVRDIVNSCIKDTLAEIMPLEEFILFKNNDDNKSISSIVPADIKPQPSVIHHKEDENAASIKVYSGGKDIIENNNDSINGDNEVNQTSPTNNEINLKNDNDDEPHENYDNNKYF